MSALMTDPYRAAEIINQQVVLPEENELFIDLDTVDDRLNMFVMLDVLRANGIAFGTPRITTSRSKDHSHVRIQFGIPLTPTERILLQACLGSDRKRELLSFLRIRSGCGLPPTVFFETRVEEA